MTPAFTQQAIVAVGQIMRLAAREIIMPAFGRLGPEAIRCKSGPLDLVTDADEAAERFITTRLRDAFPAARVVGEEAVAADPGVLAVLDAPGLVFVIDPIDGTANYAAGVPLFGVMVAAVQDGVTVGGAILDPVTDRLALAVRGGGAWEDDGHGHRCGL
ncbi:inositol monophosphatase family protein, partial [Ameyamaea chiangmaiensis]